MMTYQPKTVLYVRVSTAEQTSAHQITEARAAGFDIKDEHIIVDHGVSGVKTCLAERDQGRRLSDLLNPGDTLVVRWVDRLGRDYHDVSRTMRMFLDRGVIIRTVTSGMVFDGTLSDPMAMAVRDALLAFMSGLAAADAAAKAEARRAGIKHALNQPDAAQKYRGRKPSFDREQFELVRGLIATDKSPTQIADETGLSRQAVYKIKDEPNACDAALQRWGM